MSYLPSAIYMYNTEDGTDIWTTFISMLQILCFTEGKSVNTHQCFHVHTLYCICPKCRPQHHKWRSHNKSEV